MSRSESEPSNEPTAAQREHRRTMERMAEDLRERFGPTPVADGPGYKLSEDCARRGGGDE